MAEESFDTELIPRKIHYCWYGGKSLSTKIQKNIDSWKRYCPDYDIVRWDEENSDIKENQYAYEAYQKKKWAFVSDYFRIKAICAFGGIYLDTDVELIKPLNSFLRCKGFLGFEDTYAVSTCIMGGIQKHDFYKNVLEVYQSRHFILKNGECDMTTNVDFLTDLLCEKGLCKNGRRQSVTDIEIYPPDYFSPKSLKTGRMTLTENTHAIHTFDASWQTGRQRFHTRLAQLIGEKNTERVKRLIRRELNNG